MLGFTFFRLSNDQTGIQNINGVLFLFLTNTSFSNMFSVINSFTSDIPILIKENQDGLYSVLAYFLSKICVDVKLYYETSYRFSNAHIFNLVT